MVPLGEFPTGRVFWPRLPSPVPVNRGEAAGTPVAPLSGTGDRETKEGAMKAMLLAGAVLGLVLGVSGTSPEAAADRSPGRQWAFAEITRITMVGDAWLAPGHYLVVHEHERAARGEACMRFFEVGTVSEGPDEEVLAFTCHPREAMKVDALTLTTHVVMGNTHGCTHAWGWMMDVLTAIQFPGDAVEYLVPERGPR